MMRKRFSAGLLTTRLLFGLLVCSTVWAGPASASTDPNSHPHGMEGAPAVQKGVVFLTPDQQELAAIQVRPLTYRFLKQRIRVPGTVTLPNDGQDNLIWVDAIVAPELLRDYPLAKTAEVISETGRLSGTIIQHAHETDPVTRMRRIRLAVPDANQTLRAQRIVDVELPFSTIAPVLAVPDSALLRTEDGGWSVFVEHKPNQYKAVDVTRLDHFAGEQVIQGIPPKTRVVVKGALYVGAELAKGGFDPHRH